MTPPSTRLAIAFAFFREPERVVSVCLTVALGALALILADGFIDRTFQLFREDIIRAHFAHVQVLPDSPDGRLGATDDGASLRAMVSRELEAHGGAIVAVRLSFAGLIAFGDRTVGFLGEGVEPGNEASLSKAVRISAGGSLAEGRDDLVLLGEGLARSIGAAVGDRVTLLANVPDGGVNAVELTVTGTFHTATKAYDDRALRLPISTAKRLTRVRGVSKLMVLLPDTDLVADATTTLRTALSGQPVQVKAWTELADFYNKTVELFSRQLGFVRAIILTIVLLACSNAMARNVLDQQREIGTMMALGARRGAVARKFVFDAAAMGVLGGLAGLAFGAAIAGVVTWIGIPMPPPPGTAHGFTGGINFSPGIAGTAFALVVCTCVVGSLLPALRASRVTIVDALRAER